MEVYVLRNMHFNTDKKTFDNKFDLVATHQGNGKELCEDEHVG